MDLPINCLLGNQVKINPQCSTKSASAAGVSQLELFILLDTLIIYLFTFHEMSKEVGVDSSKSDSMCGQG